MRYVGLDFHTRQSTFCVLDENGKKLGSRTVRGHWPKVINELAKVKRPFSICFEASTGYGHLYERLKTVAQNVKVAHPGHLFWIYRTVRKNDPIDAEKLAKMLLLEMVPGVWVPSEKTRAWRGMIEFRSKTLQERTRVKNEIRALLRSKGIIVPMPLWTKKGMNWLKGVTITNDLDALRRDMLIEQIESLNNRLKRVEKELNKKGQEHPGVGLLMTIPGVGIRTGEAVTAYIDDPFRFSRNKAIGSYFGIVPCQDASAAMNRLGHITQQGPATVRRLIVEATWQGIRRSPEIRSYFERVKDGDRDRRKIAIVATAHYLLRVMLAMLRTGEMWRYCAA